MKESQTYKSNLQLRKLTEMERKEYKTLLSKFKINNDNLEKTKIYIHTTFPEYVNSKTCFYPFIVASKNKTFVAIRCQVVNNEFLCYKGFAFYADDKKYEKALGLMDLENHKNDYRDGKHSEWSNFTNDKLIDFFKELGKAKKANVRIYGLNNSLDYNINPEEQQAICETFSLYQYLTEYDIQQNNLD